MDERPDPLEMPPALVQVDAPVCAVHGKMTFFEADNANCIMVHLGAAVDCACFPDRFECGGFDGERCEVTEPVKYADWLAGHT